VPDGYRHNFPLRSSQSENLDGKKQDLSSLWQNRLFGLSSRQITSPQAK